MATVTYRKEFPVAVSTLWERIGKFDDLSWTGDDPWVFEGQTRSLAAFGMKEELVSSGENTLVYRMIEGPFKNFQVTISAEEAAGGSGSVAVYCAVGDMDVAEQEMVREGAAEAFEGLVAKLGS